MRSSLIVGKKRTSSILVFISFRWGPYKKNQSNIKQIILVTSLFQGISYSNELKLDFITVQSEWTHRKHHRTVHLLNESNFKRPKEATDTRLPKIQNESTVSDHHPHHHHSYQKLPVSHAHLTELNMTDTKSRWFLSMLYVFNHFFVGILQVESTGWWHAPQATVWGCFSCRYTPTQSFVCTYYFVYIFQHSRMVL